MRWLAPVSLLILLSPSLAQADVRVFEREDKIPLALDLFGWVSPRLTVQAHDERPIIDFRPNPAFTVPRARLGAAGVLGEWGRVQIEVDFAREIAQPIDAFAVFSPLREKMATVNLTLGQFRVPFSRQNMLRSMTFQLPDPAYFVASKFLVDRDLGAMVSGDLIEGRARYYLGIFDGNDPGKGQQLNLDPYFLFAGRVEVAPLGPPPRFEGDLRSLDDRHKFVFTVGGGAMRNRAEDKHYNRTYIGVDAGAWFEGASLYAEYYRRADRDVGTDAATAPADITAEGLNLQAGYFLPLPFVREHLELVGRFQVFDPNKEVDFPANDAGARDLDQSNPTWGYMGFAFGLNAYVDRGHELKLQASYEIRNETKECLEGQVAPGCTGFIDNNLFVVQATAGF